jgi:ABC-type transporter Mla MlaB component
MHVHASGPEGRASIDGALTLRHVSALRDEIGARCSDCLALEIDLAGVTEIDAAGLQWMVMARRGWMVRFVNLSAPVVRMLASAHDLQILLARK